MKILVANEGMGEAGGVDSYLTAVLPGLRARGHDVGFLHYNRRVESGHWPDAVVCRTFGVLDAGLDAVVAALETWSPDVCCSHNMQALEVDRALVKRWPVVKMMHGYFGTCIGGQKSFAWPQREPCARRFGAPCLAFYFPRRCGQLRPTKMLDQYRWATEQRHLLDRYTAVIVASEHMRTEYLRNGVDARRLHVIPLFALDSETDPLTPTLSPVGGEGSRRPGEGVSARVLFLGRMTKLKGGDLLIRAVRQAQTRLGKAIELVMAGDGPQRQAWESLARDLALQVTFTGWVDAGTRSRLLSQATLVAVPSVWPEPFGLVGLEAASLGVPAVAFDVGGVRQWLQHGHNGILALADPPTAERFSLALVEALARAADPHMRNAARSVARSMSIGRHLDALEDILHQALRRVPGADDSPEPKRSTQHPAP